MSQFYTSTDHFVLIPAIMLALFGCAVLLFDFWLFPNPKHRKGLLLFVVLGLVFTGIGLGRQYVYLQESGAREIIAFHGALTVDNFSLFFNAIFLISALVVAIVSYRYLEIEGEHRGEYYGLILLAQCGMYFLACGTDLVTLFVGLELMALSFYILVGFLRGEKRSNEAAMKYLLLGAFSSGILAYGFSLLYGI
ncbi:MAG: NADH-quinone oxidoreductase subunit N, partial [Bryobacteraceae bacterium]|nr:NADH-quinone oxidoreductase subunit N [Bryobacteraceae bacterium]